jgi:hypothetical protein
MREDVTLIARESPASRMRSGGTTLPRDLLQQVRGRVRTLALLMMAAFAIDPFIYFAGLAAHSLNLADLPPDFHAKARYAWASLLVVVASAALRAAAGSPRVSPTRLLTIGLVYEPVLCFAIALLTDLQIFETEGILPNLTWVPAVVILFPLILPAPPRQAILTAAGSATMPIVVLVLLEQLGLVTTDDEAYANVIVAGVVAVGFASMGSRVVYGLGRAVTAARELGSYRLEEKLGAGGMGEVWRASHRLLARPAALKLIRQPAGALGNGTADARARFEREAQVIARLRSPHTVTLFDFGVSDDGTFYYAMELLDGLDADKFVRRFGAMPPARVVHVIRQMCHSLSEAERNGLAHRDIKPANVFLCRYGEDVDFVKVLDFGLVKTFGASVDTESALTQDHVVAGTPAFMAPEQALGAPTVDGRADLYATGCVAYWLLTGTPVFSADSPMGLLLHHAQTLPEPPSARAEHPVPAELDRIVLACLAKRPKDRPQSARELSSWLAASDLGSGWEQPQARAWWDAHLPAPPQTIDRARSDG